MAALVAFTQDSSKFQLKLESFCIKTERGIVSVLLCCLSVQCTYGKAVGVHYTAVWSSSISEDLSHVTYYFVLSYLAASLYKMFLEFCCLHFVRLMHNV